MTIPNQSAPLRAIGWLALAVLAVAARWAPHPIDALVVHFGSGLFAGYCIAEVLYIVVDAQPDRTVEE